MYVADYDADTADLSLEEDGLYSRMLRAAWKTEGCSLPSDRIRLARVLRLEQVPDCLELVIERYWKLVGDRLVNHRLSREAKGTQARQIKARSGGIARAARKQDSSNHPSSARATTQAAPKLMAEQEPSRLQAHAQTQLRARASQSQEEEPRITLPPPPLSAQDQPTRAIAALNGGEGRADSLRECEGSTPAITGLAERESPERRDEELIRQRLAEADRQKAEARAAGWAI